MRQMLIVIALALMIQCGSSEPQNMNRLIQTVVCREIKGSSGRCFCCNNLTLGGDTCDISHGASFFTESCTVMRNGGFRVVP